MLTLNAGAGMWREISALGDVPLSGVVGIVLLSLLPLALLSVTSFLKLSVVLSILRNALGAQGVPSAALSALLSLLLTIHIMRPVAVEMAARIAHMAPEQQVETTNRPRRERIRLETVRDLLIVLDAAAEPLADFLRRHSGLRQRRYFIDPQRSSPIATIGTAASTEALAGESFYSLIPAFVFSELAAACALGVRIFLPFMVIDLVVASVLVGMGMGMVSPVTVALPLKLLLFVSVDGWFLLAEGLVRSYGSG